MGWSRCEAGPRRRSSRPLEPAQVVDRPGVILVARILLDREHDGVGATKRAISSTCPCVSSPTQPSPSQSVRRTPSHVWKISFVVLPRQARVAHLRVAQQPFLGHEHQTLPVDVEAAPLEHDALAGVVATRLLDASPGVPRRWARNLDVLTPVVVLRPTVERPREQHDVTGRVVHADGRRIAEPHPVGRNDVQTRAVSRHAVRVERRARIGADRLAVAEDLDRLVIGEHARDLRVDPWDRVRASPASRARDAAS